MQILRENILENSANNLPVLILHLDIESQELNQLLQSLKVGIHL